jgi:sugar phosphate isomerase/epimerase
LYSVREATARDFAAAVRRVAAMGYAGIETSDFPGFPGVTAAQAAKLFKDLGLVVPSVHTTLPVGAAKNEIIETAKTFGASYIVSGKGRDDFKTLDLIKKTCDLFNEANANARAAGLSFAVHNHWWEYLTVGGRYTFEVMLEHLDPAVLLQLDTYWIKTAGVDPAMVVKRMGARSPLLHIKDGPCIKDQPMTAVGDGVVDVPSIVKAGGAHTQWLIVEIDRCAGDMFEAVERSVHYLITQGLGRTR